MTKLSRQILLLSLPLLISGACDNRRSLDSQQRNTPSFHAEVTLIRNLSTGRNQVDAYFERNGSAFSDGIISVGSTQVPVQGGGFYYIDSNTFPLQAGLNSVNFESVDDDYLSSVDITMPGDFSITNMYPRYNSNADNVSVEWSQSSNASNYLLAVSTRYLDDGTTPLRTILSGSAGQFIIPDTTFEDFAGDVIPGTYYVYLIAYNEGFGPYSGIQFEVPEGLPQKTIFDPSGYLLFGTVAPLDSITVPI